MNKILISMIFFLTACAIQPQTAYLNPSLDISSQNISEGDKIIDNKIGRRGFDIHHGALIKLKTYHTSIH